MGFYDKNKKVIYADNFSFSILTMNFLSYSTDEKTNSADYTNRLKFVFEELSVIQEELNTINGFSVLDINRSYGNFAYANANYD